MEAEAHDESLIPDEEQNEIDELIGKFEYYKNLEKQMRDERIEAELKLATLAMGLAGDGKTRRVAGKVRRVKVTFKTLEKWDQAVLAKIRTRFGDATFEQYFRIGEYKPVAKEIQKLKNTAGESEILYHEICKAMRIEDAKASIEIEK